MTAMRATIVPEGRLSRADSLLATVTLGLDMGFDAVGGASVAASGATTLFLFDSTTFAVAGLLFAGVAVSGSGGEGSGTTRGRR